MHYTVVDCSLLYCHCTVVCHVVDLCHSGWLPIMSPQSYYCPLSHHNHTTTSSCHHVSCHSMWLYVVLLLCHRRSYCGILLCVVLPLHYCMLCRHHTIVCHATVHCCLSCHCHTVAGCIVARCCALYHHCTVVCHSAVHCSCCVATSCCVTIALMPWSLRCDTGHPWVTP